MRRNQLIFSGGGQNNCALLFCQTTKHIFENVEDGSGPVTPLMCNQHIDLVHSQSNAFSGT